METIVFSVDISCFQPYRRFSQYRIVEDNVLAFPGTLVGKNKPAFHARWKNMDHVPDCLPDGDCFVGRYV